MDIKAVPVRKKLQWAIVKESEVYINLLYVERNKNLKKFRINMSGVEKKLIKWNRMDKTVYNKTYIINKTCLTTATFYCPTLSLSLSLSLHVEMRMWVFKNHQNLLNTEINKWISPDCSH